MNETVKMYCGTRLIGDALFAVHIPATSFAEAQSLATRIGATIDGQLIEEQAIGLCSVCRGPIVTANYENVEPVKKEDWPDTFEE